MELMLCSLVVGDLVKGSTRETQKAVEMFRTSKRRLLWGARWVETVSVASFQLSVREEKIRRTMDAICHGGAGEVVALSAGGWTLPKEKPVLGAGAAVLCRS